MNYLYVNIALELFLSINSIILLIDFLVIRENDNKFQKLFILLLTLSILALISNIITLIFRINPTEKNISITKAITFLYQTLSYLTFVIYAKCVVEFINETHSIKKYLVYAVEILSGLLTIACFISIFNEMIISYDNAGNSVNGPLNLAYLIGMACIPVIIFVYSLFFVRFLQKNRRVMLELFCAIPLFGIPFLFFFGIISLFISFNFSFYSLYILYNLEQIKLSGKKDKILVETELELVESKNAIFISQIQPHFLYNVLNSIYSLCDSNPEKAKLAIVDFSKYLRTNLDSLKKKELISFDEELNHVKAYLRLEKLRYNDLLEVVYDIKSKDFQLPVLSIQPLVENSINHGLFSKENGGVVYIKSSENENYYEIRVIDDGSGFNENELLDPSRSHTGIDNVRSRLKIACNGTLEISSIRGVGTTAIIKIPKENS